MNNRIPRVVPPIYFLAAIVVMILLNSFFPIIRWLHSPWKYLGIVPILIGYTFSLRHANLFKQSGTPVRPGIQATVFVTGRAYRKTRNPMYLGLIIIIIGIAVLLGSLSPVIIIPIFVLILHFKFVLREERWMEEWFGEPYLKYKNKTPRWL